MSRLSRSTPVLLVVLGSLLAWRAPAQTPPRPPSAEAPPAATSAAPDRPSAENADANFPVLAVTSVEVLRSTSAPAVDVIIARGLTSTEGWTDGTLVPLTRGAPPDGVLDMVFVAEPPDGQAEPSRQGTIQAVLPLAAAHPFQAVRVRSASNVILLRNVPGAAEAKPPAQVCGPCIGRHFVAKGAPIPPGAATDQFVREEDLPANARIVRPADGVSDMRSNPNRLTVVIGENGRIVDAAWE